ncbi:MAG TPA: flagellar assembly protein FliW [Bdellovibrionales bacterium]|nr:flagellar assembly protein FliW [Bdellovibrionales bacterium]
MNVHTSRFGLISITNEDVITFPEGLLGFNELRRFVLLDDPTDEIFAWLQSCEEPGIAFPLLEPELFTTGYKVTLAKHDMEVLGLKSQEGVRYFTIITIPQDPTQMTANLKAPIVINVDKRLARQCVLQDNQLNIREPIFTRLQQRVVQHPNTPVKNQEVFSGVAVKINRPPEVES